MLLSSNKMNIIVFLAMIKFATGRLSMTESMHHTQMMDHVFTENEHHNFSAATDAEQDLPFSHMNWNFSTHAYSNRSFTPMNGLVPSNTVFLVGYPTYTIDNSSATCRDKTISRTGTINTGRQTIFLPVHHQGMHANSTDETLTQMLDAAEAEHLNATFRNTLYYDIDGKATEPVYLYDTTEYHLRACKNNQTDQEYYKLMDPNNEGDTCDAEAFPVMDAYPILGWYGIDVREWVHGETHVYEFGALRDCVTAKYVLTAQTAKDATLPTSKGTGRCQFGTPYWSWCGVWMLLWWIMV
jgi:hypothetical protein